MIPNETIKELTRCFNQLLDPEVKRISKRFYSEKIIKISKENKRVILNYA